MAGKWERKIRIAEQGVSPGLLKQDRAGGNSF